jgi:ATP-dependent helicase/nuclease subunit A
LAERSRLLYVATTRARERLDLVWGMARGRRAPAARTLLAAIWPAVQKAAAEEPLPADDGQSLEPVVPRLRRLTDRHLRDSRAVPGPLAEQPSLEPAIEVEFEWAGGATAEIGTVVHRYLQVIADSGLGSWSGARVRDLTRAYRKELELLGVDSAELDDAVERVATALVRVLEDPRGRWILEAHESARSELAITVLNGAYPARVRLDRTFVDNDGKRWIIDYKTGGHEGADVEAFLDSEVERYRPQLERYARAMAAIEPHDREIRVALYYPLLGAFRDWAPARADGPLADAAD